MKILQTSGTLNECVGQYINTDVKKREIEEARGNDVVGVHSGKGALQRIKGEAGEQEFGNSIITVPRQWFQWY